MKEAPAVARGLSVSLGQYINNTRRFCFVNGVRRPSRESRAHGAAACLMASPVMMMGRKVAADLACCVIRDTHCALTELFAMQIIHTN